LFFEVLKKTRVLPSTAGKNINAMITKKYRWNFVTDWGLGAGSTQKRQCANHFMFKLLGNREGGSVPRVPK
jgi:hypothetical protein